MRTVKIQVCTVIRTVSDCDRETVNITVRTAIIAVQNCGNRRYNRPHYRRLPHYSITAGSLFCRSASAHRCHVYLDKIGEKEVKIVHNSGVPSTNALKYSRKCQLYRQDGLYVILHCLKILLLLLLLCVKNIWFTRNFWNILIFLP